MKISKYVSIIALLLATAWQPINAQEYGNDLGNDVAEAEANTIAAGYAVLIYELGGGNYQYVLVHTDAAGYVVEVGFYQSDGSKLATISAPGSTLLGDYIAATGYSVNGGSCGGMVACFMFNSIAG